MTAGRYEIAHFRPEHLDDVLAVLADLWPYDRETSARLFRWKYLDNPHADGPLGIVALHRGRPVGFRGYFADRFTIGGQGGSIGILHPGDTCVLPDHRNQGLSVAMGKLASQYDKSRYCLFMNLSSSRNSLPGYFALGFQRLSNRILLLRYGRNPLRWAIAAWSRRPARAGKRPARNRIRLGQYGNIVAADAPRPAEMASIIAAEKHADSALRLQQDSAFFAWRYRNPVRRYAFFFLQDGHAACAYLALGVSPDGRSATILDYGETRNGALREILNHVCACNAFMALSALGYGVDGRLGAILGELRFTGVHTPQTLFEKGSVEELAPPILIRPIEHSFGDEAFRVGALDMRRIEHWRLKPICSDGA